MGFRIGEGRRQRRPSAPRTTTVIGLIVVAATLLAFLLWVLIAGFGFRPTKVLDVFS